MTNYSMLLFARPSFLEGMARIVDVGGTLNEYNTSLTPEQADYIALSSDWWAVGDALRGAIGQFAEENDLPVEAEE